MLVSTPKGAVDQGVFLVSFVGQVLQYPFPHSARRPPAEPGRDGFPGPQTLGQIPPRNAGPVTVQHGFAKEPVILGRHPHLAFPARQQTFDPIPLVIP